MGILISLIVLSLLVFFHELGHFSAARFFGVKVEVFSIGFGKKLYSRMMGDTEWSYSLIPLGGYVKMKGQDDTDPTKKSFDSDSYNAKHPWQKIIILLAGPFANILLAFLLYITIAIIGIPKLLPVLGDIKKESPAFVSGLKANDKIVSINGIEIKYWNEIGEIIQSTNGELSLKIIRNNEPKNITLKPNIESEKDIFGDMQSRKIIGILPVGTQEIYHPNPIETISYAYKQTVISSTLIVKSIQKLVTGAVPTENLGGVISIVDITSKASSDGFSTLLFFAALISVNLGVLNLLPIPALDGGHIMFNLYEMITRKAPSDAVLYKLTLVGWGLLIGLMFLGLYNDINRLLG